MLSRGGGGLSSSSDPRGFPETSAESELVFCRPAASAAAGGGKKVRHSIQTSMSSTMVFPVRPACVDHGDCAIASRRLPIPCWARSSSATQHAATGCQGIPCPLRQADPDWRWRSAMALSRLPGNHVYGNGLPATFVPGGKNVYEGYWAADESYKKLHASLFHYFLNVKSTSQILRGYLTGKEKPVREAQH